MNKILAQFQSLVFRFFWPFVIVVMVVILLVGWMFLVSPTVQKVQRSNDVELAGQQQQLETLTAQRDRLRDVEKELAGLTLAEQRRLSSVVSEALDSTELYSDLHTFAGIAGVTFSELTIASSNVGIITGETTDETDATGNPDSSLYDEVTIQATVAGLSSYPKLAEFIALLETNLPLLSLHSFTYTRENTGIFSLRFSAFVLR